LDKPGRAANLWRFPSWRTEEQRRTTGMGLGIGLDLRGCFIGHSAHLHPIQLYSSSLHYFPLQVSLPDFLWIHNLVTFLFILKNCFLFNQKYLFLYKIFILCIPRIVCLIENKISQTHLLSRNLINLWVSHLWVRIHWPYLSFLQLNKSIVA
jgi:hypothetical protein